MSGEQALDDTIVAFVNEAQKPLEALVHGFCDEAYVAIMESVQDYLIDNAQFNIKSKLDTAERERAEAVDKLGRSRAVRNDLFAALEQAVIWFEEYAAEHYRQAINAPSYGEQHGREVKGATNRDRARQLRAALAKAKQP